jgi:hypothetical protein
VRFPVHPRLSLDIELARFRATNSDTLAPLTYEATAIPLIVSLYYTALPRDKYRVNVFGGLGPMLASRVSIKEPAPFLLTLGDEREGFIVQGGVEGEYLFTSRFSISGRVLGRSATASGFFKGDNALSIYSSKKLDDLSKVDFSGFGAFLALRAYIGY